MALLIVFARMVEWAETWQAIRRASMTLLLAAAVVNLLSLGTRAARWWVFLRPIGVRSYWSALRGAIAGSGLNNLIPMSAGEAARAMLVAQRSGVSRSRVVATVALDRLVEIASYVSLLVAVPLVTVLPGPIMRWGASAKMVLVSLLALVVVLAWIAVQRRRRGAPVVELGQSRIRAAISRFTSSLTELPTPGRLTMAFGISMLSWIGQLAVYHLTARAAGVAVPVLASVAAMVAVNVAFLVQLTPGNVGIFQVIYAMTMAAFGVGRDVSVAVALLIQALQIIPVTALALVIAPRMALRRDDRRDLAAASRGFGD
ncbi:MAG TPA: lysylphosphatidylglycerol synthase transmembrane domain-containing protein [Gemmatimonadaceae bacterium]|nr:lysylphosphatidylglycerol synthase transmembrane domain-containing protein [Gemmatimonadaceae bacterium]